MFRLAAKPEHGTVQTLSRRPRSTVAGRRGAIFLREGFVATRAVARRGRAAAIRGGAMSDANGVRRGITAGEFALEGFALDRKREWRNGRRDEAAYRRAAGKGCRGAECSPLFGSMELRFLRATPPGGQAVHAAGQNGSRPRSRGVSCSGPILEPCSVLGLRPLSIEPNQGGE